MTLLETKKDTMPKHDQVDDSMSEEHDCSK